MEPGAVALNRDTQLNRYVDKDPSFDYMCNCCLLLLVYICPQGDRYVFF